MKIYLTALALVFGVSRPLIAGEIPPLKAPVRGTLNTKAADTWEDGLLCGNGTTGAIVLGNPLDETVILSHGRLFMPWEKPLPPVNTGGHLSEIRQWLAEGKYQQAADYVVQLSKQAVVIKMLLYSQPGQIDLLPALPKEWPQGKAEGLPCRGQLLIKNLEWNGKTVRTVMRSAKNQSVVLSVPGRIASLEIKQGKARISPANDAAGRRSITLPAGQDVAIEIRFDQ